MLRLLRYALLLLISFILLACESENNNNDEGSRNIPLDPSQIAANTRRTPIVTPSATINRLVATPSLPLSPTEAISPTSAVVSTTAGADSPTVAASLIADSATATSVTELSPTASPTSNNMELRALTTRNDALLIPQFDRLCFLEGDFIPFSLRVLNTGTENYYFYHNGNWQLSLNNSAVGPQISVNPPNGREQFTDLAPNREYVHNFEDLGFMVQSLGLPQQTGIPFSPTGIGLPASEYWITFVYANDQDGLTEQITGEFLIDSAAWMGVTVALQEVRLRVVSDLSECQ